jgi:regulator of protease activity HflC (stomatin/prohibitin superfamily)
MSPNLLLGISIAAFALLLLLSASVRIVREYERGVIFRLGRVIAAKGPGLFFIIPIVDRMVKVSLRTVTMDIPRQDVITRDNVTVKVNAVAYFNVVDPVRSVIAIENFLSAPPRSPRRPCAASSARSTWTSCWSSATTSTSGCNRSSTTSPIPGGSR